MARNSTGGRLKILDIERQLGVWWPLGFSRHKDRLKIPIVKRLEDGVKRITPVFGAKNQMEIRASEELKGEAERLFADVGPELWPDAEHDRSAWLTDATQNDLNGQYPRDLYWSNDEDRARLWDLFYLLVIAKTIRYYENHGRGWSYEADPAEIKAEHAELGGADGLVERLSDDADDANHSAGMASQGASHLDAGGPQRTQYSPSGFTPVNGTVSRPAVDGDDGHATENEQIQATSIGAFRPAMVPAGDDSLPPTAPSPRSSKKRKGTEDTDPPAGKRVRQHSATHAPGVSFTPVSFPPPHPTPPNSVKSSGQNIEPGPTAQISTTLHPATADALNNGGSATPDGNRKSPALSSGPGLNGQTTSGRLASMTVDIAPAPSRSAVEEILGMFADSPIARQVLLQDGNRLTMAEAEHLRRIFESVPAARTDGQAFMAELSRVSATNNSPFFEHHLGHLRTDQAEREPNVGDNEFMTRPANGDRFADTPNPASGGRQPQYTPNGVMGPPQYVRNPFHGASGLPRHDPDAGALRALGHNDLGNGRPPFGAAVGHQIAHPFAPAQGADLHPAGARSNAHDIFERTEVEIDWWADGQVQGFIKLEAGDDVDILFRKIEEEMPPTLQDRDVRAVRIEHLNPVPNTGRPFNARIPRRTPGRRAGLDALVRRLEQQAVGSVPELLVTVEWET